MMMLPAVMPREAPRRLGQACAVRLVASNASTTSITSHRAIAAVTLSMSLGVGRRELVLSLGVGPKTGGQFFFWNEGGKSREILEAVHTNVSLSGNAYDRSFCLRTATLKFQQELYHRVQASAQHSGVGSHLLRGNDSLA